MITFRFYVSLFICIDLKYCSASTVKTIRLIDLANHQIPYRIALNFQQKLQLHHIAQQTVDDDTKDHCVGTVIILQHPSVYTLGSTTQPDSGPFDLHNTGPDKLDYELIEVERAGMATYHGPGQLVIYPIIDLNYFGCDIHLYLRKLEEVVIVTCKEYGITTGRIPGLTGVWVGDNFKIAALGIKLRRWVTMHGLSVNVNPDLRYFSNIVPCGISDRAVGSLAQYIPNVDLNLVTISLLHHLSSQFNIRFSPALTSTNALRFLYSLPLGTN